MAAVIVVMGVSGVGKTTVGRALASKLGAAFAEGDDYHPDANVEKMRSGRPLSDDDRRPWLDRLRAAIDGWLRGDRPVVLACSALKARYRDRLRANAAVIFVYLRANRALIARRLAARRGHYMPASLLDSQLAALEPPQDAIAIDADRTVEQIVAELLLRLSLEDAESPS